MYSFRIRRFEFRIKHAQHTVGLWLLLTNTQGEEIYIAYDSLNEKLVQILNLKLSENDMEVIVKLQSLMVLYKENSVNFKELIYYNKLINNNLTSNINALQALKF